MIRRIKALWRDQVGASAVEFALVIPIFAGLLFLLINICVALWAEAALNFSVDGAARCMSVQPAICDTAADAIKHHPYLGPKIAPTFSAAASSCGNNISGVGAYQINIMLANISVPLSASSCFPVQD
jgi:Flp pilus assembly protein TadG